jgi:glycosyltransferase involved in cell wall biosynthesis
VRPVALIPVYDNAATVGAVVRGCLEALPDVVAIDDGSTDESGEAARAAGAELIRIPVNGGKGAAIRRGLDEAHAAGFTHALVIDADGQHPPREIPRLLAAAREDEARIWIGVRRMPADDTPAASRRGRSISNFWTTLDGWRRCRDAQSGFRVYPVEAVRALRCEEPRFAFEMEVLVRAAWAGVRLGHVEVDVRYPPPEERVTHFDMRRDNLRFTWVSFRLFWGMVARSPVLLWRRLTGRRVGQAVTPPLRRT